MHARTGLVALVGSVCMTLALVLAWAWQVFRLLSAFELLRLTPPMAIVTAISFTATTVGYGGAAWYVAQAIVSTARQ